MSRRKPSTWVEFNALISHSATICGVTGQADAELWDTRINNTQCCMTQEQGGLERGFMYLEGIKNKLWKGVLWLWEFSRLTSAERAFQNFFFQNSGGTNLSKGIMSIIDCKNCGSLEGKIIKESWKGKSGPVNSWKVFEVYLGDVREPQLHELWWQ